jgi:hypothetical protein
VARSLGDALDEQCPSGFSERDARGPGHDPPIDGGVEQAGSHPPLASRDGVTVIGFIGGPCVGFATLIINTSIFCATFLK